MTPHLVFDGQCEEAFRFYAHLFAAEAPTLLSYGESPMEVPAEQRHRIVHGSVILKGRMLAGADAMAGQYERPTGFFLLMPLDSLDEAERVFAALAEGGEVKLPLQGTFWSPCFGVVIDRFGVPWEITIAGA